MNFSFLKNPFLAGIIAGIIMLFLALINKKLSSEKNNPEYVDRIMWSDTQKKTVKQQLRSIN